jgi:membrane dipeptidase
LTAACDDRTFRDFDPAAAVMTETTGNAVSTMNEPRLARRRRCTGQRLHRLSVLVTLTTGWCVATGADSSVPGVVAGDAATVPAAVRNDARPEVIMTAEGLQVHAEAFVFDGHNDLPWKLRTTVGGSLDRVDLKAGVPAYATDIPRLRLGNVGAQFWSVYAPSQTARMGTALQTTIEQMELVRELIRRHPETFQMALSADDVDRCRASGRIASLIGVEGGHCIEGSLANLRRLYDLGARYMTLTHADSVDWADAATDNPRHGGLTPFGEEVVREMNRVGMLVDLSHVSADTMRHALRVTEAPVVFSHSSARAISDHPRNVPDDVLTLTAANGGVVMVTFYSGFVHPESARKRADMFDVSRRLRAEFPDETDYKAARKRWEADHPIDRGSVHDVVDHIDHIVKVAGIDHVGIGSDFDGVSLLPRQLEDVSGYPVITQELLNRGYRADQIVKIMSGNILRVLRAAGRDP